MTTSTLDLLCMLGDKAVYVVMLMAAIGQPIEQRRLEAITGYAWQTLDKTLFKLVEHRMITRQSERGPWSLTPYGQQLRLGETLAHFLPPSNFEGGRPQVGQSYPQVEPSYPQQPSKFEGQPSNFEGQDDLVSSSSRSNIPSQEGDQLLPLVRAQPSNFEGQHALNYDALANYGIEEPACSQLAELEHVTPRYIDAHCSAVLAQHKDIALAIYRMRQNWKAPRPVRQYLSEDGISRLYTAYND